MRTHPTIELFETKAELLETTGSKEGLDEAISLLAGWIDLAKPHLTEDDLTILSDIGAMLYREGLKKRLG